MQIRRKTVATPGNEAFGLWLKCFSAIIMAVCHPNGFCSEQFPLLISAITTPLS
jgi:hypothetical protein